MTFYILMGVIVKITLIKKAFFIKKTYNLHYV